jgi:GNAT superfamily N-acetyltransferase
MCVTNAQLGEVGIRLARSEDASWIVALVPRLHEFGPPPWRAVEAMDAAVAEGIAAELAAPTTGSAVLAAFDASGVPLGFVSLATHRDYFTAAPHGHVVDIVVARAGEGRGVGRALLAAAERWAEEAGYAWLTLNVFEGNARARRIYEQAGYIAEMTKMLKPLRRAQ